MGALVGALEGTAVEGTAVGVEGMPEVGSAEGAVVGALVGFVGLALLVGFGVLSLRFPDNTNGHHQGQPKRASPSLSGAPKGTVGRLLGLCVGRMVGLRVALTAGNRKVLAMDFLTGFSVGVRVGFLETGFLVDLTFAGLRVEANSIRLEWEHTFQFSLWPS